MFHRPNYCQKRKGKMNSLIQQQTKNHKKKMTMSSSPYHNNKNFLHHYKLSGHWEAKYWWLQPELHRINHIAKRILWRVNIAGAEELFASPI
jgi:hypothetical protein